MVGNSDDKTNFPHKFLITDRQVSHLRNSFSNNSSRDIKLSKTQLSKMIQLGEFLGRLLGPLLKTELKCSQTISKKCFDCSRINCSSIGSRCWNT